MCRLRAAIRRGFAKFVLYGVSISEQNEMTPRIRTQSSMLYGADGRLLFSGGITGSRGHSGDNEGRRAIVSLLTGEGAYKSDTPVFGCSLFDEDDSCSKGEKVCGK